jgi:FkbM family methyltransferase
MRRLKGEKHLAHSEGMKDGAVKYAREQLFGSRLFPTARNVYQYIFDREKLASRRNMLDFYSGFVSKGDLVFDVGANFGEYSDAFLALGAHVVAIEPNAACCERLKKIAKRGSLVIENCALGRADGQASMHICSQPGLSTLSNEWYETARTSPLHSQQSWSELTEVRVTTLDALAAKHGRPSFIKIDVEGFEVEVLAGMSFKPKALSFEFHFSLLQLASECLRNATIQGGYRFNYLLGNHQTFQLVEWVGCKEIELALSQASRAEEYGEIFCRRT